MPRGNNTCVWLNCQECKMQNYNTRINPKRPEGGKVTINKFCPDCNKHTEHKSGKKITHSKK